MFRFKLAVLRVEFPLYGDLYWMSKNNVENKEYIEYRNFGLVDANTLSRELTTLTISNAHIFGDLPDITKLKLENIGYFQSKIPNTVIYLDITNYCLFDSRLRIGLIRIKNKILDYDIPWNGSHLNNIQIADEFENLLETVISEKRYDIDNLVHIYRILQKISSSDTENLAKCKNCIKQIILQIENLTSSHIRQTEWTEINYNAGWIQIPNSVKSIFLDDNSYDYLNKYRINDDNSIEEIHIGREIISIFNPFRCRLYNKLNVMSMHEKYYENNKLMFYSGSSNVYQNHPNLQLTVLSLSPDYNLMDLKPVHRVGFWSREMAAEFWNRNKDSITDAAKKLSKPNIYEAVIQNKTRYCIDMDNFILDGNARTHLSKI